MYPLSNAFAQGAVCIPVNTKIKVKYMTSWARASSTLITEHVPYEKCQEQKKIVIQSELLFQIIFLYPVGAVKPVFTPYGGQRGRLSGS